MNNKIPNHVSDDVSDPRVKIINAIYIINKIDALDQQKKAGIVLELERCLASEMVEEDS